MVFLYFAFQSTGKKDGKGNLSENTIKDMRVGVIWSGRILILNKEVF